MTQPNKDTSPLQEKIESTTTDGMKNGEVRIIDGIQYTYVDVPTKTQKIIMLKKEISSLNAQLAEKEEKIKELEGKLEEKYLEGYQAGIESEQENNYRKID